jgi:hypothetical protein
VRISNNIAIAASEKRDVFSNLAWFFEMTKSGAPWDIKLEERWKDIFENYCGEVPYYNVAYPFIFEGSIVNAEVMGNINFGSTGAELGFGTELLR